MNEEIVIEMNFIIVLIIQNEKSASKILKMSNKSILICFSANHSRVEFNSKP